MSDPVTPARMPLFTLTPRQRRLRVVTLLLLAAIAMMIIFAMTHPFFRFELPPTITPAIRKALAVKGLIILGYWTVCLALTMGLILMAWLDLREIRRKIVMAQRDIWKDIIEQSRKRRDKSSEG
ncbi:MAG TPA: hypothetical protein VNJ09_00985 [Chthonomonadales bacterium]|nr:hypothetical protein [Chthonomonadales bacterium]